MKVSRTQYEPGNGTRYDLSWYYDDEEYLVVTWWGQGGSGGSTIRVNREPSEAYVREKMVLPRAWTHNDLAVVTGWIRSHFQYPALASGGNP